MMINININCTDFFYYMFNIRMHPYLKLSNDFLGLESLLDNHIVLAWFSDVFDQYDRRRQQKYPTYCLLYRQILSSTHRESNNQAAIKSILVLVHVLIVRTFPTRRVHSTTSVQCTRYHYVMILSLHNDNFGLYRKLFFCYDNHFSFYEKKIHRGLKPPGMYGMYGVIRSNIHTVGQPQS